MNSLQKPRILIDESLPVDLAEELPTLTVATVRGLGWTGLKKFDLALLVLLGPNRIESLRLLVPSILTALPLLSPGTVIRLGA